MELRKSITIIALRTTFRITERIERAARALAHLGQRIENAAERQADKRQVDIVEVLETLHAEGCARQDERNRSSARTAA
jgi:hypothetical protein